MDTRIAVDEDGEWDCLCGNHPAAEGFYPVDESGTRQVEPTVDDWTSRLYACAKCGRIIASESGVVVTQIDPQTIAWTP